MSRKTCSRHHAASMSRKTCSIRGPTRVTSCHRMPRPPCATCASSRTPWRLRAHSACTLGRHLVLPLMPIMARRPQTPTLPCRSLSRMENTRKGTVLPPQTARVRGRRSRTAARPLTARPTIPSRPRQSRTRICSSLVTHRTAPAESSSRLHTPGHLPLPSFSTTHCLTPSSRRRQCPPWVLPATTSDSAGHATSPTGTAVAERGRRAGSATCAAQRLGSAARSSAGTSSLPCGQTRPGQQLLRGCPASSTEMRPGDLKSEHSEVLCVL
mmetsp:Transcript_76458/g.203036  ORF Transcript_76458/g.203036 Transcript_76458/m.203036 type:complete len:269 (-) Transcript_76458:229-1035(-)